MLKTVLTPFSQTIPIQGPFHPQLGQYAFLELVLIIATRPIPLTAVDCIDSGYVGKQSMAGNITVLGTGKKVLQENMYRCTGRLDRTEILLKTALSIMQLINQSRVTKFRLFQTQEIPDENSKIDIIGRKFSTSRNHCGTRHCSMRTVFSLTTIFLGYVTTRNCFEKG